MIILYILFFAFVILLLLSTILFSFIRNIFSLFGLRTRSTQDRNGHAGGTAGNEHDTNVKRDGRRKNKKLFDKNEGEYVDFEEIK